MFFGPQVNPKFKTFNRPTMLAIPVGLATLAMFAYSVADILTKKEYQQKVEFCANDFMLAEGFECIQDKYVFGLGTSMTTGVLPRVSPAMAATGLYGESFTVFMMQLA
jgi:hypothetical protein